MREAGVGLSGRRPVAVRLAALGLLAVTTGLLHPGASDAGARLAPLPAEVPGSGGYAFLVTTPGGDPVRFDPCRPVRWVLRPDGAPPGGDRLVHEAVGRVARSTGLRFLFAGTTDEAPSAARAALQPDRYGPGPAPVLIAWSTAAESPQLAGARVALGVAAWSGEPSRLRSGQVLLDVVGLTGLDGEATPLVAPTVLHELGHVVGLDHVDDPDQLMHPTVTVDDGLGAGDLRGLRAAGSGPCS